MKKSLKKIILVNLIVIVAIVGFIVVKNNMKPVVSESSTPSIPSATAPSTTTPNENVPIISNSESPAVVVPANRCIVTILGKKYDVTDYRNMHPGGNVFTCGTDMTSAFNNKHGADILKKAAKYLVN